MEDDFESWPCEMEVVLVPNILAEGTSATLISLNEGMNESWPSKKRICKKINKKGIFQPVSRSVACDWIKQNKTNKTR